MSTETTKRTVSAMRAATTPPEKVEPSILLNPRFMAYWYTFNEHVVPLNVANTRKD